MTSMKFGSRADHQAWWDCHLRPHCSLLQERDPKGLYALARKGIIKQFTGVSDPYEVQETAELVINTAEMSVEAEVERVIEYLRHQGYF